MHWETIGTTVELANGWNLTSESGDMEFEASQFPGNTSTLYRCGDVATFEWAGNVLQFYASIHGKSDEIPWWLLFETGHVIPKGDLPKRDLPDGELLIRRLTPDDLKQPYPARFHTKSGTITFNENKTIVVSNT